MHFRIPLFRIWYSTTYTVLFIILIVFLAVTPGDTIYQSFRNNQIQKIFVVAGVYLLTFLIVLLVYSTRLYTNRSVLQGIPKAYIPVEDGEVGKIVRRMIVKALRKSAIVAWDSKPRDVGSELQEKETAATRSSTTEREHVTSKRKSHTDTGTVLPVSPSSPPWGHVSHPGWGSPASPDLPNIKYREVISELPNLIEAKAVSLAPPDPAIDVSSHPQDNTPILPDAQVVALLQRPVTTGLRAYLERLSSFGLINPPSLGAKFLTQYEYARFSTYSLSEPEFRDLMSVFAEILGGMSELDMDAVADMLVEDADPDMQSLTPSGSPQQGSTASAIHYRTPRVLSRQFGTVAHGSSSSSRSQQSESESPQTLQTAPSRLFRTPSHSSHGSVRIYSVARSPSSVLPASSSSSERSLRSARSVLRLNHSPAEGELPYRFQFDGS